MWISTIPGRKLEFVEFPGGTDLASHVNVSTAEFSLWFWEEGGQFFLVPFPLSDTWGDDKNKRGI